MAFGAARDEGLAERAGRLNAGEGRAIGIHVDFYPVADVNNKSRARARRLRPVHRLGTDDLDRTVEDAVAARIDNAGQSCNAAKRFIVIDELYEPFLEKFTAGLTAVKQGDPRERETECGPLSSQVAADRLEDQVRRAVEQGATVVAGGRRKGNYFERTVLTHIRPENGSYPEERFGPVAQVYRVGSEEEAVALANDTPFGLGSYVMTNDPEQAERVADRIDAGMDSRDLHPVHRP